MLVEIEDDGFDTRGFGLLKFVGWELTLEDEEENDADANETNGLLALALALELVLASLRSRMMGGLLITDDFVSVLVCKFSINLNMTVIFVNLKMKMKMKMKNERKNINEIIKSCPHLKMCASEISRATF